MMKGFESLDTYWKKQTLSFQQKITTSTLVLFIQFLKIIYKPFKKYFFKLNMPHENLEIAVGNKLSAFKNPCTSNHSLSEKEILKFEQTGLHGPFQLLSESEAHDLAQKAANLHKKDFNGTGILSSEIVQALKESNIYSINYSGLYQALYYPDFRNLLKKPELTHKIASLLGKDLICWRSQFFEKTPASIGTFWHQTGTFRESSKQAKLQPSIGTDLGMVQISAWIALTDSTIDNGCLRMLPGSFKDGRLEKVAYNLIENKFDFLLQQPSYKIKKILNTLKFTPGNFLKAQLIFEIATHLLPDLFEDSHVTDLEMKAGQAIIFTSLNVHASYPNTSNTRRLALGGRFTRSDVKVLGDTNYDIFPTPKGNIRFSLEKAACFQVLGKSPKHFNKLK